MGTDIHLQVQRLDGAQWVDVPALEAFGPGNAGHWCAAFDVAADRLLAIRGAVRGDGSRLTDDERTSCLAEADRAVEPYPDPMTRCYNLFARLAGVRNGCGFAGVVTGRLVEPLFADRGLPDGDSGPYLGDHSQTWLSFAELRRVVDVGVASGRLDVEFVGEGLVPLEAWATWLGTGASGPPETWCGGVSGPNIVHVNGLRLRVDPAGQRVMLADGSCATDLWHPPQSEDAPWIGDAVRVLAGAKANTDVYVQTTWTWRPLAACGFVRWARGPLVDGLREAYGEENLRLLVGFDS